MGAEGFRGRDCLSETEAGGLGGTTNCGVEGVEGTVDVVGVERNEQVLSAASKAIG